MAAKGGAGKILNNRRLSKMPAGGATRPTVEIKQQENLGRTRGKVNGKTAGTVNQANKMKAMDDAGIGVEHDTTAVRDYPKYPNIHAGEGKKTLSNPDDLTSIQNISDPNQLFKFASYNTIFTLSVLGTDELKNTKTLLTSPPHDIIIRSGGIGGNDTRRKTSGPDRAKGSLTQENRDIVNSNERMRGSFDKAQQEFNKNNDMYFKNVTINAIPGLNSKRRFTSVTQMNMEIVEPWGITLLERLKAGAANNNYLDHLDAPYMLTIEFVGWDEKGMPIPTDVTKTTKRIIPIKLTNMEMDVSSAGTTYNVQGIPYNEFAYVNRYNYVRTSATIEPKGQKLNLIAKTLTDVLNKQNTDEAGVLPVELPDEYQITIDSFFKPDTVYIDNKIISQSPMYQTNFEEQGNIKGVKIANVKGGKIVSIDGKQMLVTEHKGGARATAATYKKIDKLEYMKIDSGNAITKILEEIMKSHPDMTSDKYEAWQEKVSKTLTTEHKTAGGDVDRRAAGKDMYFNYFRIRSSVVHTGKHDYKRHEDQKIINFIVEPYKIHAYSLSIPGISTGQNMKSFVYKTYNYIFTGENVDILDVDIKYKVSYFTSKLKDVAGENVRANKIEQTKKEESDAGTTANEPPEYPYNFKSYPGVAKSAGTGSTDTKYTHFDQFLDYLTHPAADMVNVKMEIIGDPAWLGLSQFIPAVPFLEPSADGTSTDRDIAYWRGEKDAIWNDKYHCYNTDLAEPIIMLNFRMPADINDKKGTYEISKEEQATFSGLYRVVQTEHNWDGGSYTNVLHLVRFNNQGVNISNPTKVNAYTDAQGNKFIGTAAEASAAATNMMGGDMFSFLGNKGFSFADIREKARSNIFRKVDKIVQKFHPSQGNTSTKFHPSQGSTSTKFHPSQGNVRNGRDFNQAAVNKGIQSNKDDI